MLAKLDSQGKDRETNSLFTLFQGLGLCPKSSPFAKGHPFKTWSGWLRTCRVCMYEFLLSYVPCYIIIFQQWSSQPAKGKTIEIEVEIVKWLGLPTAPNHSVPCGFLRCVNPANLLHFSIFINNGFK